MEPPFDEASDEDLVERFRHSPDSEEGRMALGTLYRRYFEKVARWSLRFATDVDDAADLAQEVFVRVQQSLAGFRGESRFQTWLYTVARSVALNRADARRRRPAESLDALEQEPGAVGIDGAADESGAAEDPIVARLDHPRLAASLRRAVRHDLEPLEAQVVWLHHVHGMTLPALTARFDLRNRSGAKALLVSGMRKLRRSLVAAEEPA